MAKHILIVGAGWAGLSCAYQLAKNNNRVTLLEASSQIGGRARTACFGDLTVDNGQHLVIGAYKELFKIQNELNIKQQDIFHRHPLNLRIYSRHYNKPSIFSFSKLPAPLHFIGSILKTNLKLHDKLNILKLGMNINKNNIQNDVPILNYLLNSKQSLDSIINFWEPIALASLSTPLASASAKVFIRVLQDSLFKKRSYADLLIPKVDLNKVFPIPIANFLHNNKHAKILKSTRAQKLLTNDECCYGVKTKHGEIIADEIVLAIPPYAAAKLMTNIKPLAALYDRLLKFTYQTIITAYMLFTKDVNLPFPMIGLTNHTGQWLFDKRITGHPKLLTVVISGNGPHEQMNSGELCALLHQECKLYFDLGELADFKVIKEKQGAFSCDIVNEGLRPRPDEASLENLWLSGDYLATGYPATLEGAIKSGMWTADMLN